MRTASAPTTALSGKNMSEDSLVTSTTILAAPYAVLQPNSLEDSESSLPTSKGSQGEEHIDNAIELDEAASAPGSFALEWALTTSFLGKLVGVGGRSIGVVDGDFLRKRCMAGSRVTACQGPALGRDATDHLR